MIQNPVEYGFPLIDDTLTSPPHPKLGDSTHAPNRLITVLYLLMHSGELNNDFVPVNKQKFSEMLKEKRAVYFKTTNYKIILQKLCDFGFIFDNFNFSYPDDNNVVRVLYGYMKNVQLNRDSLMSLNYYLCALPATQPDNIKQIMFAEYLSGVDKEFYIWLNETYMKAGFYCPGGDFRLSYHVNPKEKKRALDCFSHNGKLWVVCKLYHVSEYEKIIDDMPDRIKNVFKCVKDCCVENCLYKRDTCIARVDYTIDGQFYKACTYEKFYHFGDFQPEDMEFFKTVFSIETEKQQQSAKRSKK